MKVNINFINNKSLESNHKILPNDDKAKSLFKLITLDNIVKRKVIIIKIQNIVNLYKYYQE